ncbi:3-oxoacyl-ACP reductase [Salipaludibacillus neizhouensis]|uniref:3-oxoacyl-ACP reductase n=1 Tax=Salipaludibacillus neizhouensis TaxID=885475 RepID=A0A3A9KBG4_9BACI|nr:SDR family oxidoreductase [Salipaludibacillus neizhouensis]RKL68110.1 3-oxoacyl-ACP reductase [Salipaludibacillus neizhouensis]
MELNLTDKVSIVAASSQGIGKAIAKELVREGSKVMLVGRDSQKLKTTQTELLIYGNENVSYFEGDLTDKQAIKNIVQHTINTFGEINILINNTGGPLSGGFQDFSDEDWQHAFELTLLSYIRLTREALPYLKKSGGNIVNISSLSIKEPIDGLILSNVFRMGVLGLTKSLANELAQYNILVNTVAPGKILTQRVEEMEQKKASVSGVSIERIKEDSKLSIPLRRYGTPDELAKFAVFLASDANTYMTGGAYFVDGGKLKSV